MVKKIRRTVGKATNALGLMNYGLWFEKEHGI